MALMKSKEILEYIPTLFETDVKGEVDIFRKLEKMLCFDEAFIYYANPNSLQLKYSYKKHVNYKTDKIFSISGKLKDFIFSKEGLLQSNSNLLELNNKYNLFRTLELTKKELQSFIVSKIFIKSTVFGIIVLCKKEADFYKKEDLDALNASASIISYILKDLELSQVFKMQLKALKDGIIEKNNAYKTIKEQNEKILEADKAKNEFLANISHELRTPLNSILGFADILGAQLYGELNDKQAEYIDDIKASGTHLLGMINEILDMSKIEANAMKIVKSNFYISQAIDEAANILMPLAKKKGIVINKAVGEDFEVFADYQKIQQILYNLLSNAIKYSPENDTVEIAAVNCGNSFKIAVHDNGIGIDKKYHGKIFAKFVQLDSAYTKKESSTGLGLTITKELAELHGGKVSLISEVNNGSTFIVEIPL